MPDRSESKPGYFSSAIDVLTTLFFVVSLAAVIGIGGYVAVELQRSHLMRDEKIQKDTTEMDAQGRVLKTTRVIESAPANNVKDMLTLLSSVLLFAGFAATIYQLRQSQKQQLTVENWKRTEFVANELRVFSQDQSVVNIKRLLEAMDAEYDALILLDMAPKEGEEQKRIEVRIDKQSLANGFTPDPGPFIDVNTGAVLKEKTKLTTIENKIAYELDGFCTYLIGFRKLIRDEILTMKDLDPYLKYWFGVIAEPPDEASTVEATRAKARNIRNALHTYFRNYYPEECKFIVGILNRKIEDTPFAPDAACEPVAGTAEPPK